MNTKPVSRRSRFGQIFFAGCCSVLVGACAGPGPSPQAGPCNQGVCKAEVTVQSCEKGEMTVAPDPIDVSAPNNIEWTIATPGYVFTKDGIVVRGCGSRTVLESPETAGSSSFTTTTPTGVPTSSTSSA